MFTLAKGTKEKEHGARMSSNLYKFNHCYVRHAFSGISLLQAISISHAKGWQFQGFVGQCVSQRPLGAAAFHVFHQETKQNESSSS